MARVVVLAWEPGDEGIWACSCDEEDQPTGATFWDAKTLTCRGCGAVFDLLLAEDIDGGYFYHALDVEGEL